MEKEQMKLKIAKISIYINLILFALIVIFSFTGVTKSFSIAGKNFSLSFYVSIIALPLFYLCYFFFYKNKFLNKTIYILLFCFVLLFVSSLSMSFFLFPSFNGLFDTSPVKVVLENAVKYVYDLALIPYFIFCLSFLNKRIIRYAFIPFIVFWLVFGLFQIIVFYINNASLWSFYDSIDFLKILGGRSDVFLKIRENYHTFRFYGISSEPASNCVLISIVLVPFLISELTNKTLRKTYKFFLYIALIVSLVFAFLTKSASVYVGLFVVLIYLFIVYLKKNTIRLAYKMAVVGGCILLISFIFVIPYLRDTLLNSFVLKLFDKNDYSTQHRYSTVWNDLVIFITHPLFGVGDGNQGYYYSKNVLGTWMSNNAETQMAIKGELGLLNGGSGVPSIISGFGIYGIIVIILCARRYIVYWKNVNSNFSKFKAYYLISGVTFAVLLLATQGIHRNYLLLLYLSFVSFNTFSIKHLKDIFIIVDQKNFLNERNHLLKRESFITVSI